MLSAQGFIMQKKIVMYCMVVELVNLSDTYVVCCTYLFYFSTGIEYNIIWSITKSNFSHGNHYLIGSLTTFLFSIMCLIRLTIIIQSTITIITTP